MQKFLITIFSFLAMSQIINAQTLTGKYIFTKDGDGQMAKSNAVISLSFNTNGTFSLKAVMPGNTVTDNGTYKISNDNITISFKEMEQGKQSGAYSLSEGTLILPFQMLKNKAGTSTWQKEGTVAANKQISTESVSAIISKWTDYAKGKIKGQQEIDKLATATSKKLKNDLAQGYYVQGVMLFFKKFYMDALYAFGRACQLQKENILYQNNFCSLLIDMEKYGDAIPILEDITKSSPGVADAWSNMATAAFFTGNYALAGIAIDKAITANPICGGYYYTKGQIEKKKGNSEAAQQNFEKAWDKGYAGKGQEGSPAKRGKANNNNATKQTPTKKPTPAPKKNDKKSREEKMEIWQGHYEAEIISARSGETAGEANTQFGKDMYQTNINLQTLACVKSFSMDISKSGNISGSGEILYVYQGQASNPIAGMTPSVLTAKYGGFGTNLKNGFQTRAWSFSGTIDEDGNMILQGLPSEKLDLFNTGEWQKITPWSPLKPDAAGAAMKGPFHLTMKEGKDGKNFAYVDDYLDLNDKLIKKIHYRTLILKTDEKITPDCKALAAPPEAAPCPSSEYIKTKLTLTQSDHVTVESSKTYTKGADGSVQSQSDNAVNVSGEFSKGLFTSSVEFHADGSYEVTAGIGINPASMIKGLPVNLSESAVLVYDSKCGWGVKASAAAKAKLGPTGAEASAAVEGAIFFNKSL